MSVGEAGPVYKGRVDQPVLEVDPNFDAMVQNILRSVNRPALPVHMTPAAAEVHAQNILIRHGRPVVVSATLSPEAALKEEHHAQDQQIHRSAHHRTPRRWRFPPRACR